MKRSEIVSNLFRLLAVLITVLEGRFALVGEIELVYKKSIRIAFIIFMILVAPLLFGGETISKFYVKQIRWVLRHLHTREEHRWVVALGLTALCDVFMDTLNMAPFIVLSALSMIMICVVAVGWDSDRSGMIEGLLIGFGKLLVVHMIKLDVLPSIICGAVLILAITSKLTESTVVDTSGNLLQVQNVGSSNPAPTAVV